MAQTINLYDIKIINAVMDRETKRGFSKSKGTTVYQIERKTKLSSSKVRTSLKMFKEKGWVDEGIKTTRKYPDDVEDNITSSKTIYMTYYITAEGLEGIKSLKETSIILNE